MKSYTELRTMHGDLTNNTTTSNLNLGSRAQNDAIRAICAMSPNWDFLESSITDVTVASQNNYDIPYNSDKINAITITSGSIIYYLDEVTSRREWDELQYSPYTSDIPEKFYVYNDEILIYPTPSTNNLVITIYYKKRVIDLSNADYTTGTITVTNGDETIAGSGTTFTSGMVGRFLKSNTDGNWYEIASFTNTTAVELKKKFKGVTAAGASYTIGEMPILPEAYHDMLAYYSASQYWLQQKDINMAREYRSFYEDRLVKLKQEHTNKTVNVVLNEETYRSNPNLFVRL